MPLNLNIPQEGETFKLGKWTWRVYEVEMKTNNIGYFHAARKDNKDCILILSLSDVTEFEWNPIDDF